VKKKIITESDLRPLDESMTSSGQVRKTPCDTFLLVACTVLSYAAPAPLTAIDTATRPCRVPKWFFFFYSEC